jgi:hypothetical protein
MRNDYPESLQCKGPTLKNYYAGLKKKHNFLIDAAKLPVNEI